MNTENRFLVLFSMAVVLVLLAACGSPQPTATMVPASEPAVIATDTAPAPLPAEADPEIPVAFEGTDAAPVSQPPAASVPENDDVAWTYVALGDSVTWGMIPRYAEMLEEELGVTVIVQNWTAGGDHSSRLLERLRTSNRLRRELGEADVITIEIPWNVFKDPVRTFLDGSPGACGGTDNQDCLREALETYKADTGAILAEIVSLRSPSVALIRIQDTYQFNVKQLKAEGAFEIINEYWREANAHVIEVAENYHIPVAGVYDAFMGEEGVEDPQARGLLYDGIHTTSEGAALMAELLRELGYEYAVSEP